MHSIPENFNGYLNIDGDVFAYHTSKTRVTLSPASRTPAEQYACIKRLLQINDKLPKFVYGSYQGYQVAFFINSDIRQLLFEPSCYFVTPMIIKTAGNLEYFYNQLSEPWNKFCAITFYGGNINFLHPPLNIIDHKAPFDDEFCGIKIKNSNEYTHKIKCIIDSEDVELTISIQESTKLQNNEDILNGVFIGTLNSYIRLSFTTPKDFYSIEKYASLMRKLISLLTMQNNVFFNIYLSQRNKDGLFYKTADCKLFDSYQNYATKSWPSVILLTALKEYLPTLIARLNENVYDSILDMLPKNNIDVHRISIYDIQNLCSALETVYNLKNTQRPKNEVIQTLKNKIKNTIAEFIDCNPGIDIYQKSTISSAFQYLDFTLKDKIITLYEEHKKILDKFCSEKGLPTISSDKIGAFVKLRNQKAHGGSFELNDSALLYYPLFMLSYICMFEDLLLPNEKFHSIAYLAFLYR